MDKIFANGLSFKKPQNAPDYVIGSLSVKVDDFIPFLKENASKGWVNLKIMQSKVGKYYVELDQWKADKGYKTIPNKIAPEKQKNGDDLPF